MTRVRTLLIVPTLGTRDTFLRQSLESLRFQSTPADIVVVCPPQAHGAREIARELGATILDDPGSLPAAINAGASLLETHHEFVNWLGDDDFLEPGSLESTIATLDAHPQATVAYGRCRYVTDTGRQLWVSGVGPWASRILAWGPDLIPQPGMLVRSGAWRAVGGVDESLTMAFDLDLLLKLKNLGPLVFTDRIVSNFRWHATSLTASDRSRNLDESEAVKRRYLGPVGSRLAWAWEAPVRLATRVAANRVQSRAVRESR